MGVEMEGHPPLTRRGNMYTAILIDGTDHPVALRINPRDPNQEFDKPPFITSGAGPLIKNFKFTKESGDVLIYRPISDGPNDKEFERLAAAEADKFLNPAKYRRMGTPQDETARRLAAYEEKYGPLKEN